ncbi:hypothetical protein PsYK624_153650 [Phanerochaete sordida]|uniref:Uncharacterized protein n=1 Tax=Phanerochaete sordida TaxID=48140 RepID=A0A9P3GRP3_9APHY|nr:hypothetical protein PsYK624_153650 [Phanerochaete sordida]
MPTPVAESNALDEDTRRKESNVSKLRVADSYALLLPVYQPPSSHSSIDLAFHFLQPYPATQHFTMCTK